MAPLRNDTIGGFNTWLDNLQNQPDHHASVTLTTFNVGTRLRWENQELMACKPLTTADYDPANGTALNDALDETIGSMKRQVKKGDRVLFLIITDGEENSSVKVKKAALTETVKALVKKGWEFQYIGANVDAFIEGTSYGFTGTTQTVSTSGSTQATYGSLSGSTSGWMGGATLRSSMPTDIPDPTTTPVTPKP